MATIALDRFPTFADLQVIANADGYALDRYARQPVNGCHICDREQRNHGWRHSPRLHQWIPPTDHVRKLRMLARRHLAAIDAARRAETAQLHAEIASWPVLEAAAPKLPARDIRADVHEVLVHGEWRPVVYTDPGQVCGMPGVWIGLSGYSRFCPNDDTVPARETTA